VEDLNCTVDKSEPIATCGTQCYSNQGHSSAASKSMRFPDFHAHWIESASIPLSKGIFTHLSIALISSKFECGLTRFHKHKILPYEKQPIKIYKPEWLITSICFGHIHQSQSVYTRSIQTLFLEIYPRVSFLSNLTCNQLDSACQAANYANELC